MERMRYEATIAERIEYAKNRGFIDEAIVYLYDLPKGIYRTVTLEWLAHDLKEMALLKAVDLWIITHELDDDFNKWYTEERGAAA